MKNLDGATEKTERQCPSCEGFGYYTKYNPKTDKEELVWCKACDGEGYIEI